MERTWKSTSALVVGCSESNNNNNKRTTDYPRVLTSGQRSSSSWWQRSPFRNPFVVRHTNSTSNRTTTSSTTSAVVRAVTSEPLLFSSSFFCGLRDTNDTNAMAVSMENPQDPEHAAVQFHHHAPASHYYHYSNSTTNSNTAENDDYADDEDEDRHAKHASKYPKRRRHRKRRHSQLWTFLPAQNRGTQVTALAFSIILTVLVVHRLFSLYMSSRIWINAPITYMPRQCSRPNYATILHREEAGKICVTTLTDARRNSPVQRFLRWRNFDGILELTWHNKLNYARKHDYHFYDGSDWMDTSRPPAWSKIKAVQHLLEHEQCDWVMWTDADTVIMNSDKTIEDFLPADPTKDLLVGSDKGGGYNSGVFVIRNTAWSKRFLEQWWNMKSFVNPPGLSLSGDNHALKALLRDMVDFDAHVLSPARCTFNSFAKFLAVSESAAVMDALDEQPWYQSEDYYHKGDFLAHSPGYDNKEHCLRLLLQEAQ